MTRKCDNCGSTDIDVDPSRADAVCTNCGSVLESGIIVSDIQFEGNAHGGSQAIGTFVSGDSKGGGRGPGGLYSSSIGRESREITLRNARKKIVALAQQLRLRPDHIDMAFYFFKLALSKHLTRGRKSSHVIAACVYITCRTEGTSHMLIDFSDILQIDVYELGRTYLRLSQALCINIPAMDPCLYVMRFAHKLEFGDKTHEVSMTALRLVSRMKKDWIHFGRRPSGLCGAALLIAARLHEFCRTVHDVIKVVKVHESTLRKRLNEFGETPTSQLTLDEFMTIDLDAMTEEQDPPSYRAARNKDRERLERLEKEENFEEEVTELESEIERLLEERRKKVRGPYSSYALMPESAVGSRSSSQEDSSASSTPSSPDREAHDLEKFLEEDALDVISSCVQDGEADSGSGDQEGGEDSGGLRDRGKLDAILMPPPVVTPNRQFSNSSARQIVHSAISPGVELKSTLEYLTRTSQAKPNTEDKVAENEEDEELDLTGIDDDEIDSYIMNEQEIAFKTKHWMQVNSEYLKEQEEKRIKEELERAELIKAGKDPDKKKKAKLKKAKISLQGNSSAIEAIEKMVQEKKMSTKINYDVLRNLTGSNSPTKQPSQSPEETSQISQEPATQNSPSSSVKRRDGSFSGLLGRKRSFISTKQTEESVSKSSKLSPQVTSLTSSEKSSKKESVDPISTSILPEKISALPKLPRVDRATRSAERPDEWSQKSDSSAVAISSHKMPEPEETVIVESGPIEPDGDDDYDDDDEDMSQLSAVELLSRHMGGDHYGYDEEYY